MLTDLRIQGFKSWEDTGLIRLAPLIGLFGPNSSGKTAILQLMLMLKQTVESADRLRVLHTGDERTYVDLGTFYDIVHAHQAQGTLSYSLGWKLPKPLAVPDPEAGPELKRPVTLFTIDAVRFQAKVSGDTAGPEVQEFVYDFESSGQSYRYGMRKSNREYEVIEQGYQLKRPRGRPLRFPPPVKSYGFPDEVSAYYTNAGWLADLVLAFEQLFQRVYYLGPLRDYPRRSYVWAGERPQDVGRLGELAIPALLASRSGPKVRLGKRRLQTVEERVAYWLRELRLIHSFTLRQIAEHRREYEVRVQRTLDAPEVLVTDVGFGVSQILPVLVLCYYVPEGSTIILEQPEIHLHPAVQAGLADVFIDAIKTKRIQILVESHSEHLLRRLQRRVAEETMTNQDAALYFCGIKANGTSQLTPLALDVFGNISNWPEGFFGDEIGDLVAQTEAAMQRQQVAEVR